MTGGDRHPKDSKSKRKGRWAEGRGSVEGRASGPCNSARAREEGASGTWNLWHVGSDIVIYKG